MSAMFPLAVWQPGTLQPSTPFNDNALRVEILLRGAISILSTPPGSPADGDVYILGSSPTGAWSTFAQNDVVLWRSGTWYRFAPFSGWLKQVGSDVRRFSGTAWEVVNGGGAVPVQDEGSPVVATPTAINFVGAGVTTMNVGGVATVTIPGATGGGAPSRATFIGGQSEPATIFLGDEGLRLTAEGFGSVRRTARCALTRGPTGLFYFEVLVTALGSGGTNVPVIGVCQTAHADNEVGGPGVPSTREASWGMFSNGSGTYHNGSVNTYGSAWSAGDVIMVAVNLTTGRIWWGRNGTWFNSGNPASGTNAAFTNLSSTPGRVRPAVSLGNDCDCTFRLKASAFTYSPPSGFSAWDS